MGEAGVMRRDDYIRHIPEWGVGGKWFFFGYIEASSGHHVILQGFYQIGFVDDAAAADIDNDRGRLHKCEFIFVEQMMRFVGVRECDNYKIGLPELGIQIGRGSHFFHELWSWSRSTNHSMYVSAEGMCEPCCFRTDLSHTDDEHTAIA